ncbi:class I SAM-dependent methyltransferase [candidate division TA06 bacterium]|nr:class I SAM-dependent methyltransferase [candidate division TA06 bacterium]
MGKFECLECGQKFEIQDSVPVFWNSSDEFKHLESDYYGREAISPSESSVFRNYYRFTKYERKIKEKAISFLKPHSLILTLGGGDGRHGVSLCQMGHEVLETDLAPRAGFAAAVKFREANCKHPWAVAAIDAEQIPFEAETFDAVYICAALHQMPERYKVAEQVGRVLKKGGVFIMAAEPNAWFYKILRPLAQLMGIRSKQLWGQSVGDEANRGVSYIDIVRFCERAGLEPLYIQPKFFLTGLLYQSTEAFYRLLHKDHRDRLGTRQWEVELLTRMDFIIGLLPGIQRYPFYWTVVAKKT